MAARSRGAAGRGAGPLFTVLVDYATLAGRVCETASGQVVAPGALVGWLDRAMIERAVFGPDGRVEIGRRSRLFRGATRRAIEVRDRECTHPMCDEPADRCEVDHIIPYRDGGETTQANGHLQCDFHNRDKERHPPDNDNDDENEDDEDDIDIDVGIEIDIGPPDDHDDDGDDDGDRDDNSPHAA
jgi:hypothetical protein